MKQLRSIKRVNEARQQLSRIIKAYFNGELDATLYRNLVYGFSHLLAFQRAELDMDIEKRLEAIEEKLNEQA